MSPLLLALLVADELAGYRVKTPAVRVARCYAENACRNDSYRIVWCGVAKRVYRQIVLQIRTVFECRVGTRTGYSACIGIVPQLREKRWLANGADSIG